MSKRHIAVLVMLILASGFALIWGLILARASTGTMLDYQVVYTGARCFIQHCDPYNEAEVMRVYFADGGARIAEEPGQHPHYMIAEQFYPPSAELIFAPFGALKWPVAYCLWVALTCILMTVAAFLIWDAAQEYAPDPPFYLACIVLANAGILYSSANPAGLAVSLCIIGVWCIAQQRLLAIGVLSLAMSLAIKPHDSGAIWLALLLLGGVFRKRAIQTLAVVVVFAAAGVFWISQISPGWFGEMRSNILQYSTNGSRNDPAGASMLINLQPVLAAFRNEPHFYNFVSYLTVGLLFVIWIVITVRNVDSSKRRWLGLAAVAALSLLPLYHRSYDAKLLLLTLPACAALWAEGGLIRWVALTFTASGILITSSLPMAALDIWANSLSEKPGTANHILFLAVTRPAGLVILAVSIFYLWAYARQNKDNPGAVAETAKRVQDPVLSSKE